MPDENSAIWELIARSITEELSLQEKEHLDTWLTEDNANQKSYQTFQSLSFILKAYEPGKYKGQIFHEIEGRIKTKQRIRRSLITITSIAAAAILFVSTAIVSFHFGKSKSNAQMVEIFTPKGVRSKVSLPDGSSIFLNANSRVIYPASFSGETREIEFEGEGFFTIAKDKTHPFIVKTETVKVRVVGTRFDLKSYKNDDLVETTLEEGSVKICNIAQSNQQVYELKPGRQAVFDKRTSLFRFNKVEPEQISAWQQGNYYFKSKTFEEIAHILERGFDVSIDIKSESLKKEIFTGDFVRNENIEQILTIIQKNTDIRFKKEGQKIVITEKESY